MRLFIASLLIAGICSGTVQADDEWRAFGQALLNEIGRQSQNQNQNQPRSAPMMPNPNGSGNQNYRQYAPSPNGSGNQNFQNLNGRNNFFGPSGGTTYPQNNFRPYNPQPQYQNVQPRRTYPSNSYTPPRSSSTISSRPVYRDPPVAPKVYSNLPITIRCAQDCVGICNYSLLSASGKSYPYTIRAGQVQQLKENTDWQFRYQPNGSAYDTFGLRGGKTYELRQTAGQWQFYLVPD